MADSPPPNTLPPLTPHQAGDGWVVATDDYCEDPDCPEDRVSVLVGFGSEEAAVAFVISEQRRTSVAGPPE